MDWLTLAGESNRITGEINADREAEIPLEIKGADGRKTEIKAVIDTGFTDYLTLPPKTFTSLRLAFRGLNEFVLADGNVVTFKTYASTVLWDGAEKSALVLASEGGPLIGMSLLYGYHLIMDVADGGIAIIEAKKPQAG